MSSNRDATPDPASLPTTLRDLDRERFGRVGVRDELRRNLARKLRQGEDLFPGIVGYEESVVPQIVNAILARHDLILLGLRGQAKTRLCRMISSLLDDFIPAIPGCPLRSHPLEPLSAHARSQAESHGEDLPIEWIPRSARYHEKLATPDVSMADLIGDVDPLKAAHERLDLADERVIHYGLIPRSNRGLFTVNELPDLAPRIQVGLLNILEEQDIQIRGFPLRFELDVLLLFTANPEDYTNRGSIITPLKDRIASQILTHYPRSLEDAHSITESEAWTQRDGATTDAPRVPTFIRDITEAIAFQGRQSEYVDQTSGVSARLSIAARELLVSQCEQRMLRDQTSRGTARMVDLGLLTPAITGKVELVYEGEQEGTTQVARRLVGNASQMVFDQLFPDVIKEGGDGGSDRYKPVLDWFAEGQRLDLSDRQSDEEYREALEAIPGLSALVDEALPGQDPDDRAAAMELVLEGLHLHSLVAKQDLATGASYTDMLGIMMEGLR